MGNHQASGFLKRIPGVLIPWIPALFGILLLWVRGISPWNLVQAGFWPIVFLVQLWFFLAPFRTVTAGEISTGFTLGLSVTSPLIWLAATLLDGLVGQKPIAAFLKSKAVFGNTNLTGTLVAPLTEEILKMAVPMLLLFILNRWGSRPMAKVRTPIDYLILAAASGAGFSLFENLFRAADGAYSYLWPKFGSEVSWAVGPFRLFPEMYSSSFYNGDMIWFGHAGTAAAAGLAIGLFFHTRKRIVTLLLPVATILVVIWDHLLWNYGINKSKIWWKPTLGNLTMHGRLLPVLYLVMLIGAMLLVWQRYRWYLGTANARRFPPPSKKGWKGLLAYAGRHRYVLMAAFGLHEALHDRKKRTIRYSSFIGGLVRKASIYHDREEDD